MRKAAKARAERNAAWRLALSEGRVVRYNGGDWLVSYPTIEARDAAYAEALRAGMPAEILRVVAEDQRRTKMAIENRNLEAGTRLVATYKKQTYVCTVEKGEEGNTEYVLEDGKRFKSPSAVGSAVMGGSACNGWRFWSIEGDAPAAVEPKAEEQKPEPKAKSKARRFKLFKRIPGTGLEEGQYRFYCAACAKSFITDQAEPEVCPEGHRDDDPELTGGVGTQASAETPDE